MYDGSSLPSPPAPMTISEDSNKRSWVKSMKVKIVLTILIGIYLVVQLALTIMIILVFTADLGFFDNAPHIPWPLYLFCVSGFLFQIGIIGLVLWLLWKKPKKR